MSSLLFWVALTCVSINDNEIANQTKSQVINVSGVKRTNQIKA